MSTPEWVELMKRRVTDNLALNLRIARGKRRKAVASEHGGDGMVHEVGVVKGSQRLIEVKGKGPIIIRPQARVVVTTEGEIETVSGGSGGSITLYEAGQVAPDLKQKVKRALGRARSRIKRRLGVKG